MRNAIVIFTKVPKAGETKTRLTTDRGGIFTPEEAKKFYEACLLDVIDNCVASGCCDVYICHNRGGDGNYLKLLIETSSASQSVKEIFSDQGGYFDCAMQYAADYIMKNGEVGRLADSVLIIGGDMPCLQPVTIQGAVKKLEIIASSKKALDCAKSRENCKSNIGAAIIESADQAGGFNIIGYTCTTPFKFDGVFYNQEGTTVLDMVLRKALESNIPLSLVETVLDIDIPEDLGGLIPVMNTLQFAEQYDVTVVSPKRTIIFLQEMGIASVATVPQN